MTIVAIWKHLLKSTRKYILYMYKIKLFIYLMIKFKNMRNLTGKVSANKMAEKEHLPVQQSMETAEDTEYLYQY